MTLFISMQKVLPRCRFAKAFRQRVVTIHGLDWQRAKWGGFATRFLKYGERNAVKYADEIIVLSKNVQNYFKEKYGRDTVLFQTELKDL